MLARYGPVHFTVPEVERVWDGSVGPPLGVTFRDTPLRLSHVIDDVAYYEFFELKKGTGKEDMPRVKRDPGMATVPRPKAPPKTDPLDGLDYTIEKEPNGRWRADCLGITSYGTTKKQALFMLGEELNGFKSEPVAIAPVTDETAIPPSTKCQEASPFGKGEYVPCGEHATAIVYHEKDKRSYYMCLPCADHNVRNRGGVYKFGQPDTILVRGVPMLAVTGPEPTPKSVKGESYSIEDAELLWGIEFPSKPDLLRQLFLERIQLKDQADRTKARIDEINRALLGFYDRQGVGEVKWEDYVVALVKGSNTTLDREALVLAGVPAELITQCTKRKEYTTIRVTGPKGGD